MSYHLLHFGQQLYRNDFEPIWKHHLHKDLMKAMVPEVAAVVLIEPIGAA